MPSPSKIPRPKYAAKKQGKENVGETKQQTQQNKTAKTTCSSSVPIKRQTKPEVKTFIKSTTVANKQKKSPLRVVQENKYRQQEKKENQPHAKTTLHDRRGISEIKRSEQNLRITLDAMEHDVQTLKDEISTVQFELQKSRNDVTDLKEKEMSLQEKVETLEKENLHQAEILEALDRDPVKMSKFEIKPDFESLLLSQEQKQISVVQDLRNSLVDMKMSLNDMNSELDNLTFDSIVE